MKNLLLFLFLFSFLSCKGSDTPEVLTLEEKIAKMLIVGFDGYYYNPNNQVVKDIVQHKVAGVILFERNITPIEKKQNSIDILKDLCDNLQKLRNDKIIISIDQEGGRVTRLKEKYGFPKFVSAKYLGDLDNQDSTKHYAQLTAKWLNYLGINTNYTPVADVIVNPNCPVIAKLDRAYSSDYNKVIENVKTTVDCFADNYIYTSLKHFPGHGSSAVDSHLGFTDVSSSWQEQELEPFKAMIADSNTTMIMVSHLFNSRFDDTYPATLSEKTVSGLLRTQLGWNGVVVTDDMLMKAIVDNYGFEQAVCLAINAGCDLFIYSGKLQGNDKPISELFIDTVVKLVKEGKIKESTIEQANKRVDKLLNKF